MRVNYETYYRLHQNDLSERKINRKQQYDRSNCKLYIASEYIRSMFIYTRLLVLACRIHISYPSPICFILLAAVDVSCIIAHLSDLLPQHFFSICSLCVVCFSPCRSLSPCSSSSSFTSLTVPQAPPSYDRELVSMECRLCSTTN